jgi:hypothetical protein
MGQLIEDNRLGIATEWDAASVAVAMKAMIANPVSADDRSRLAAWTEKNFSLRAVGKTAAERVLASTGAGS